MKIRFKKLNFILLIIVFIGIIIITFSSGLFANDIEKKSESKNMVSSNSSSKDKKEETLIESQNCSKKIMGIYEYVIIYPYNIKMPAKLDTGADTSSIHGENVEIFKKDGKKWVKFNFDWNGKKFNADIKIERPLVRMVRIKNKGGESTRRPVISLEFCLDGKRYLNEFTVADRENFRYPLLLGRRFLRKVALIDPDADYLTTTNGCDKNGGKK